MDTVKCNTGAITGTDDSQYAEIVRDAYFAGRMGGHFVFDISYDYEQLQDVINWQSNYDDKPMTTKEAEAIITEAKDIQRRVFAIKSFVNSYNKGLKWPDELKSRIDEQIEAIKEEQADIKKRKSSKNNMNLTLADLLQNKTETIKRHALGILKAL